MFYLDEEIINIISCEVVLITKQIFKKKKYAVCLGKWTSWLMICRLVLKAYSVIFVVVGLFFMGCGKAWNVLCKQKKDVKI